MRPRLFLAVIVALALAMWQTLAPLSRVNCAMRMGTATSCPSCMTCTSEPSRASLEPDHTCCAARSSADRDPAIMAPDCPDDGLAGVVMTLPVASVLLAITSPRPAPAADLPGPSPPTRPCVVLLI